MTNVFVAGSRRVSHLGADVRRRLEMIQRELAILVGDANDVDKAIQVITFQYVSRQAKTKA